MKTLVIARNGEDTSWAEQLKGKGWEVFVVNKYEHLPAIGREASSFLWYIREHYDSLEGDYCFCQAKPFDHAPKLLEQIDEPYANYREFGNQEVVNDDYGQPHHKSRIPVGKVYEDLFGTKSPGRFGFKAGGGQFKVNAQRIKQRPKEFYVKAFDYSMRDPDAPWVLERLWRQLFG